MQSLASSSRCRSLVAARPARRQVVCNAKAKLYSNPASRGRIIEWYLHELGKQGDVEVVNLDMKEKKEHKADWFLKVNPFGKLPALVDGDVTVYESGAILLYLADKYGETKTVAQRAAAAQWALFANSTLAFIFVQEFRERSMPTLLGTLNSMLSSQPYIQGSTFSVSDVAVGAYLLYIPAFLPTADLSPYPHVQAYMKRLSERPACAATVAARAQQRASEDAAAAKK